MFIEEKDIQVLEKYIPNIREAIKNESTMNIIEMIDDLITDDILEHNDEPSTVGRELQLIYDRIQRDN